MMEYTQVTLSETITKRNLTKIWVPTNNPFRPDISGCEDSQKQIYAQLENDAVVCLPESMASTCQKELRTLQGSAQCGLIYISTSLAVILDLDLKQKTLDGVLFDVCIMVSDRSVQVLTVVDSNLKWNSDIIERNEELSKGVLYSLRDYTDVRFNVVHGVIEIDDLQDTERYQSEMIIIKQSGHYINPNSLAMTPKKCVSINKAFLIATAIQHGRCDDATKSDSLKLLGKDQYDIVQNYIDTERVIVEYKCQQYAHDLLNEVARRLSRSGKICSQLHSSDKTDDLRSDCEPFPQFTHHVAIIEDPSELRSLDIKGHIWLFVEDITRTKNSDEETLCGVCTLETELDDCKRLARSLVDRKILPPDILQDLKGSHKWNTFWRSVNFAKAQRGNFIKTVTSYSKKSAEKLETMHEGEFSCVCDRKHPKLKQRRDDQRVDPPELIESKETDLESYHPDLAQSSTDLLLEEHLAVQTKRKNSMLDTYLETLPLPGHFEKIPGWVSTADEMECSANSKRNSSVSVEDSGMGVSAESDGTDDDDCSTIVGDTLSVASSTCLYGVNEDVQSRERMETDNSDTDNESNSQACE